MWQKLRLAARSTSRILVFTRTAACTLASVGLVFIASRSVLAQQGQQDEQPQETKTLFVFDYAGGAALFSSPKDDGLRRALAMIPDRFSELRQAIPDLQEIPEPIVEMILTLSTHPLRMAATDRGFDPNTGMPGIGFVASWEMSGPDAAQDARTIHAGITGLMLQAGGGMKFSPSQVHEGFSEMALPFGALSFGPRQDNNTWRYEVLFGLVPDADEPFAALPDAPIGLDTVFRGSLDLSAWTPIVQMFGGMAMMMIPNGADIMKDLHSRGITGPDAMAFEATSGYRGGEGYKRVVSRRMKRFAPNMGMPTEPLGADVFSVIPADATFAQIKRADLGFIWQELKKQLETASPGHLEKFREEFTKHTGLDLEADLIDPLGTTHAAYLSDSTGGGSFLSAVGVFWLDDAPRMRASLGKLLNKFNEAIKQEIDGPFGVRFVTFDQGDVHFIQLRTPGLPIPIEPTFAIAGNKLIAAATPQACLAAALQVQGRAEGDLRSNNALKSMDVSLDNAHALLFVDSQRTLRTAYPYATLLGSALSNAVRSHENDSREPGIVVPPYSALVKDAKPLIALGFWEGEDYVMEVRADASILVNACGVLGVGDLAPLITGGLLGGGIATGIAEQMQGNRHEHDHWKTHEEQDSEGHDRGDAEY
jgi:hypothetical protein